MNILFVSSEVAPFSKTGGLADVSAALPAALAELGHDVTVVTPLYGSVDDRGLRSVGRPYSLRFPFGDFTATLREARLSDRHRVVFIEQAAFFQRPGLYQEHGREYADNHRRFAFFSMAALTGAQILGVAPDIVHLNDWQTGLAAVALARGYRGTPLARARSVFTLHNVAYQGNFPKWVMDELGLPWDLFTPEGLEFYDQVSFLKAGIAFADALTTVSPRHAQEIQTPEGGFGLDGFLRARADVLHGILNGVDYSEWDPANDPHLPARYDAADLSGKAKCKEALLRRFELEVPSGWPVFGVIGRLADQKGIDILLEALSQLLHRELAVIVLGSGEPRYEQALLGLRERFRDKLAVQIGFDSALAHLIEAGADFFLMPSRYEPCGLNQMYSLRYGTVPIVRATGGLEDTVVDLAQPEGTGIKFLEYSGQALEQAVHRALVLYEKRAELDEVRRRGMACDFSWKASAQKYDALARALST